MGILKWGLDAATSTLRDQALESFRAEGLLADTLAVPAMASNAKGNSNVITNGSVFDVAVGQAALLIQNGKVHDFVIATDEDTAGRYVFDSKLEPSLLYGGLGEWKDVWNTVKRRFQFGGESPNKMSLVYINLKEITDNKVGVGKLPFIDKYLGTRLMLSAHGTYTFKITDPVAFYENLLVDVNKKYKVEDISNQLRSEMMPKIQSALARLSPLCENGYQDIFVHDKEIATFLNEELADWKDGRGISLVKVALVPQLSPEDEARVMKLENAKTLSNADMALGSMVNSHNNAIENAASNPNGALNGFMALNTAGSNNIDLGAMLQNQQKKQQETQAQPQTSGGWTCSCGAQNSGNFCTECGKPKPTKKFCPNCGAQAGPNANFCSECGTKIQ